LAQQRFPLLSARVTSNSWIYFGFDETDIRTITNTAHPVLGTFEIVQIIDKRGGIFFRAALFYRSAAKNHD
jgi:hypothetical protein